VFSVHVFVKHGTTRKPVALVVMSGRRAADQTAVIRRLVDLLPEARNVQSIPADFEGALWQAVYEPSFQPFNSTAACSITRRYTQAEP